MANVQAAVDFIGVGAQRSATSWLYSCLSEHPEICAPEKEIHFFSRPRYEEKGVEWYKRRFTDRCKPGKVTGEFSTSYLSHPEAAKRIHTHFPDAKIVICLREPVARARSQYALHGKVGWIDTDITDFETFIQQEPSAIAQGLYKEQIERYLALFPREQIHFILKDDIDTNPQKVLHDLFGFLGVDAAFSPSLLTRVINSGAQPRRVWINNSIQWVSHHLYRLGLRKVVFYIKRLGIPALIRRINRKGEVAPLTQATDKALRARFAADVAATEVLTGLPLKERWGY